MIVEDSIDIRGLKPSDLEQLWEMYEHTKEEECYWGRKDYWDLRIQRIDNWFKEVVVHVIK